MELKLFTVKDYDNGLRPERIRGGARLIGFHYFPGAEFCFVGVDNKGVTHQWRSTGRKNGKVNDMHTDLVLEIIDPNAEILYLARTPAGNFYAGNDLQKVKDGITKAAEFDVYRFEVNFKKQIILEWQFLEKIKQPKK